ncbi:hypothetical protein ACS0TY_013575 [Phlomoides rotata]
MILITILIEDFETVPLICNEISCLCRDGIHLLSEGSKVVVEEILKTLKNVMWEPSLYWLSIAPEFREDSPYYPVNLDGKTTCNVSGIINNWQRQWLSI